MFTLVWIREAEQSLIVSAAPATLRFGVLSAGVLCQHDRQPFSVPPKGI